MDEQKKNELTAEADGIIEGRNAVIEALRAGVAVDKVYLARGETDSTLGHIAAKAHDYQWPSVTDTYVLPSPFSGCLSRSKLISYNSSSSVKSERFKSVFSKRCPI